MIIAISPHLDDVVFSIGGYLSERVNAGEEVQCVTVFTGNVPQPEGFALACQLDKGIDPGRDYMALRKVEDQDACRILGLEARHLTFLEAPHRGYRSANELFAGIKATDTLDEEAVFRQLTDLLEGAGGLTQVLYPFGAGNHVDHRQIIGIVDRLRSSYASTPFRQYYDMPYARKHAQRYPELAGQVPAIHLRPATLEKKVSACAAYRTQVQFQFGGPQQISEVLGDREYLV